jgi:hypothetical protein
VDQYRVFWEQSFDRLDLYLQTVTAVKKGKTNVRKSKNTSTARSK